MLQRHPRNCLRERMRRRRISFSVKIRMKRRMRRLRRISKRSIMINMKSMKNYQHQLGNNPIDR